MKPIKIVTAIACIIALSGHFAYASNITVPDTDQDGISDQDELGIYHTDSNKADTDNDGFNDGDEIAHGFDPNKNGEDKLERVITVSLKDQHLTYSLGSYKVGDFAISSGLPRTPTPPGDYTVLKKKPLVDYKGPGYNFPRTKWNLYFLKGKWGGFYIHGAYWHTNFGKKASHGCVNVSYENMEKLYNWAEEGTRIVISE